MFYTKKIVRKDFAVRRNEINRFLSTALKELNEAVCEKKKKKQFLVNFAAFLNVELAVNKTYGFDLALLFECINKDNIFRKIFNYIDRTKHENLEFMLLAKGGYYGPELQKLYSNIKEDVVKKLLDSYIHKSYMERNRQFGITETNTIKDISDIKNSGVKISGE